MAEVKWALRNYVCKHCGIEPVEPEEAGHDNSSGPVTVEVPVFDRQMTCGMAPWMLVLPTQK